jgi:hypothetical protein
MLLKWRNYSKGGSTGNLVYKAFQHVGSGSQNVAIRRFLHRFPPIFE